MNATLASVWEHTRLATRGALVALALTAACGQSTTDGNSPSTSSNISDTAAAYLALSDEIQACRDDKDACVTSAAGDATKLAACDTAAESCIEQTRASQGEARRRLGNDAEGCVRECRRQRGRGARDDSDGGAEDGMSTRDCFGRRAPFDESECSDAFFTCLDETGVRESGTDELDDETRAAVSKCVDAAHTCRLSEMRGRRPRGGRRGSGMRDGAAGEPAVDAGTDRRGPGRRDPRADAGAADDDDRAGRRDRGRRGAAGEPAVDAGI